MREFALDEDLIKTLKEMDELILQKCLAYEDRIKAFNSVVIEWLNSYPDFEGIIAEESYADYQSMKNSSDYIEFIDLLYDVEIPSERVSVDLQHDKNIIHKDDSNIKLPGFNKMRAISSKYDSTLLIEYLCYLV